MIRQLQCCNNVIVIAGLCMAYNGKSWHDMTRHGMACTTHQSFLDRASEAAEKLIIQSQIINATCVGTDTQLAQVH
eukprot:1159091-Pelagomonas_calceolata.AAC.8